MWFWISLAFLGFFVLVQAIYYCFISPPEAVLPSIGAIAGAIGGGIVVALVGIFVPPPFGALIVSLGSTIFGTGFGSLIGNWGGILGTAYVAPNPIPLILMACQILSVLATGIAAVFEFLY